MRHLRSLRLWFGVPAVLVGVAIGVLTNIATTTPTWPIIAGLVSTVAVLVGLTVWQASRDERNRVTTLRADRTRVLKPIQPTLQGEHTISTLLAAEHALAPFRARQAETKALTRWCLDATTPAVHVVAGPSGVGKSRLAVEIAKQLPNEWVTGRCANGKAADLLPPVLACEEPTLVVVDDADTEPDVASLIKQLSEQSKPGRVKVLLLVRDASLFEHWVHQKVPAAHRGHLELTTLDTAGEASDRRRWFVEAARAYAVALALPPPAVSDTDRRPVGTKDDPMIIIQARAVLTALTGPRDRTDTLRTSGIDRVAADLVEHERPRWDNAAEDPRWGLPADFTVEAREEALLALVLLAPDTYVEAIDMLRRLPRYRTCTDENLLRNIATWAHYLYPGSKSAQVDPSPDFLRGALLATLTSPAHTEVTDALLSALPPSQASSILTRLIRAATLFDTVVPLIEQIVHAQRDLASAVVESLILAGPTAWSIEQYLLTAVSPAAMCAEEINFLIHLLEPTQLNHLKAAFWERVVQYARDAMDSKSTDEARAALANSLNSLGAILWKLGRHREALALGEEAVSLWRELAEREPAGHTHDLANSLNNLGIALSELGQHRQALTIHEESVSLQRELAKAEPTTYSPALANSLNSLGTILWELGRHRAALALSEEAVSLWRELAEREPARHTHDLANSLNNLGIALSELGQHQQALTTFQEAVSQRRKLAKAEPTTYSPALANSLNSLGTILRELDRHQEALTIHEEAVSLRRKLAEREPARHTPDLANSLNNLGIALSELGQHQQALTTFQEAVSQRRKLAEREPARHTPDLANSLNSLGLSLSALDRHQEALATHEEAVSLRRKLAEAEPTAYLPALANSLNSVGVTLRELGRHRRALTVYEESVGLRRKLAQREPARHTPDLANSLTNLATVLCQFGRHDEELELRTEAAAQWRILSQLNLAEHERAYQRERHRLAASFSQHGRDPGAAWQAEENLARHLMPPAAHTETETEPTLAD